MRGRAALASALPQDSMSAATARRQRADRRPLDLLRDLPDGIKVFRRRRREASLDNIHLQPGELARERSVCHDSPGGFPLPVLAISQSGIKHRDL